MTLHITLINLEALVELVRKQLKANPRTYFFIDSSLRPLFQFIPLENISPAPTLRKLKIEADKQWWDKLYIITDNIQDFDLHYIGDISQKAKNTVVSWFTPSPFLAEMGLKLISNYVEKIVAHNLLIKNPTKYLSFIRRCKLLEPGIKDPLKLLVDF